MPWRFPDRPTATSVGILSELAEGDWIAEIKFDGWRTVLGWDGREVTLTSRHRTPIPASPDLVDCVTHALNCITQRDPTRITESDISRDLAPELIDEMVRFLDARAGLPREAPGGNRELPRVSAR